VSPKQTGEPAGLAQDAGLPVLQPRHQQRAHVPRREGRRETPRADRGREDRTPAHRGVIPLFPIPNFKMETNKTPRLSRPFAFLQTAANSSVSSWTRPTPRRRTGSRKGTPTTGSIAMTVIGTATASPGRSWILRQTRSFRFAAAHT